MLRRQKTRRKADAELDITSFLNLMIVLVPVLLMMMVFSRITVVELRLPDLGEATSSSEALEQQQLELLVQPEGVALYFPAGYLLKQIPAAEAQDWAQVQAVLKQLKQTLVSKGADKKDIVLMVDDRIDYQQVISLLQTTRSYKDVLVASVVDAELFPEISFADIPSDYKTLDWTLTVAPEEAK